MRANNPQQQQPSTQAMNQGQMPVGGRMGQQMSASQQEAYAHVGDTMSIQNHDHDLIHELSDRIDAVWRYDQYIANADGKPKLQEFWRDVKQQDMRLVERLKQCIAEEVQQGCF